MFSTFAGLIMAAKVHFTQMKYPIMKKQNHIVAEEIYQNEVKKIEVTEKYEKSLLPESGYMTVEEYEAKSRAKSKAEMDATKPIIPKDENMVYVPQRNFTLVKYNNPIGSPELSLPRKLNFDRQINAQGIVSGDKTMLVYPAVYYYAETDCTSCDLFLIKLNPSLSDVEKVMQTNIIQREETPLISTSKDIDTKFMFRTLTPIDFSMDNKKLAVKEKIGYRHDGIWSTDLWVYDFENNEATKLPQIREAILEYWKYVKNIDFTDKRWDIYPMGFDANDDSRIIVCAYAYTGEAPKFLGTWSIGYLGDNPRLEGLDGMNFPISVVGYRLEEGELKDISEIEFEAKQSKQNEKAEKKEIKNNEKFEQKVKKLEYERKIRQMDIDTMIRIQELNKQKKIN